MTAAGFRLNIDHGRWWLILGGLLSLAFGVLLIIAPLIGAIVLTWLVRLITGIGQRSAQSTPGECRIVSGILLRGTVP